MAIFKCKMCGGSLDISPNDTIVECEYCGVKQTLPRLDSEKRANYYERADHYRRQNEYDKAMSIYEQILAEDKTDAEAYWSIVLCRYGVEYVKDPVTQKHVPTINRTQSASILADPDYQSALQYADGYQRDIYVEQANAIHEIQKGILTISQREEPFDVFICYKESDSAGRRTPDSVLAQELYYELGEMGYRVFFSRITLEDKLGSAYEPYIFAALQSAKVMVVLGTKPEYFEAVWVRNEWSRFLGLIGSGEDKILIPAYRDMDPYDLPREFSHLQAQDMSKLGFMQDLIRGIGKLVPKDADRYFHGEQAVAAAPSASMIPNYLKRISMFVADGFFDDANEYCDKVLDLDPENADAYLYVLLSADKVQCKNIKELAFLDFDFTKLPQYQRAYHFADKARKAQLESYAKPVLERLAEKSAENAKNEQRNHLEDTVRRRRAGITRLIDEKNKDLAGRQRALQTLDGPRINAASLQHTNIKTPNRKVLATINLIAIGAFFLTVLMFAVGVYALGLLFLLGYVLGSLYSYMELSRQYWPHHTMTTRLVFYLISFNITGLYLAVQVLRGKEPQAYAIGQVQDPNGARNAQRKNELQAGIAAINGEIAVLRQALDRLPKSVLTLPAEDLPQLAETLQAEEARSLYRVVILSCNDVVMMAQALSLFTSVSHENAGRMMHTLPACVADRLPSAEARDLQKKLAAYGRVDLRLVAV